MPLNLRQLKESNLKSVLDVCGITSVCMLIRLAITLKVPALRLRDWWRGSDLQRKTSKLPVALPWRDICTYRRNVRHTFVTFSPCLSSRSYDFIFFFQTHTSASPWKCCAFQVPWAVCGQDTTALMKKAPRCSPWAAQNPDQPTDRWAGSTNK